MSLVYIDGEFTPKEEAKLSVFDHGVLYGDGVFEGIRAYNGRVFRLREHIERLHDSAKVIKLDIGISLEEMEEIVLDSCRKNDLSDAYIRLIVTRGKGDLGLDPQKCAKPSIICIAADIQLYPEELYEKGLEIITVPTRRNVPEALSPRIKSLNYLNNIMAKIEANLAGVPEALMVNQEGYVAEATGDNIFIIKKGVLITPPKYAGILEGITRNVVMEIAGEVGLQVKEELFTRYDVFTADECFLTGTAAELIPVIKIDDRYIGDGAPGEKTTKLINKYRKLTRTEGAEI